ncbi:MAG TPA: nuclear transport factor 2 family protein [Blastocatellia bacterium]|nr:nuclear transport factor 2 family protein [Blastocatellia bacterium]
MIKKAFCAVSSVMIVLLLALDSGTATAQGNQERELLDIENRITSAYMNKNLEAFFQDNDEGLSAFHASNPYRIDDRRSIESALKTFYKYSSPTGLFKVQPRVQIYGDAAVVTYHFIETGEAEGGKLYAYEGKQTDVFVKKQGRWTLVHFHSSRVVKPN